MERRKRNIENIILIIITSVFAIALIMQYIDRFPDLQSWIKDNFLAIFSACMVGVVKPLYNKFKRNSLRSAYEVKLNLLKQELTLLEVKRSNEKYGSTLMGLKHGVRRLVERSYKSDESERVLRDMTSVSDDAFNPIRVELHNQITEKQTEIEEVKRKLELVT